MRIEKDGKFWIIVRGESPPIQVFSFFWRTDRTSWSVFTARAARYRNKKDAIDVEREIRRRQKVRRDALRERTK